MIELPEILLRSESSALQHIRIFGMDMIVTNPIRCRQKAGIPMSDKLSKNSQHILIKVLKNHHFPKISILSTWQSIMFVQANYSLFGLAII
ncbi:hypothetical protein ABR32_18795 [Enterobacter cloacae subsp. dissolvens]|nr:hypothetical protein ABR32_18795 [Enterobacter cloacae subsp. dissolvens]KZP66205.1 hypothetical protein A3N40_02030 [Enterobacter cloacae subsp. dissolvens]